MKSRTKSDLLKSGIHAGETFVVGGAVLTAVYLFRDDSQVISAVKDALMNIIPVAGAAFLAKLNRMSDKTPGGDYVND
jgi:hypothetical protein